MTRINELRDLMTLNLDLAHERQKQSYNKKHHEVEFNVDDPVWKRQHVLSSAIKHITGKLCKKYESTKYIVFKILSPVIVELSTQEGKMIGPLSVSDVKSVYKGTLRTRR